MLYLRIKYILLYCWNFIFLSIFGYEKLSKKIQTLSKIDIPFKPFFSGRVAICNLAQAFNSTEKKALLPDYICNVVNISLEAAGYTLFTYKLDKLFEADIKEVISILESENISLLLTASIYGSSAMTEDLQNKDLQNALSRNYTHVLIDLCQDFRLINKIPANLNNISIAVSFNDKSFPSAMGGGIFTNIEFAVNYEKLPVNYRIKLMLGFIKKILKHKLLGSASGFEFSYCKIFPYKLTNYKPSKFQLILVIAGIKSMAIFQQIKKLQLQIVKEILETRFYKTAAYIQTKNGSDIQKLKKSPYAIHKEAQNSHRPMIKLIHNKGFWDA